MYITYSKVFGGTPNILMFWIFSENGSISERTVNRGINSSYNSIKFCINKQKILIFMFAMYQNYPSALILLQLHLRVKLSGNSHVRQFL